METNERLLQAVQLAARKLSGSDDFDTLLKEVLAICVEAVGAEGGTIYLHDPARKRLRFRHVLPAEVAEKMPFDDIPEDQGLAGKAFSTGQTQISVFQEDKDETRQAVASATGVAVRNMITVPLVIEEMTPIGVVQLVNKREGNFGPADISVLDTVSAVSTMAYLNQTLTEEMTRASSLLGMGKVSHDIGNLAASLNANVEYGVLAVEGMKNDLGDHPSGELYADTIDEMLKDLDRGIDWIVRYSRLISDLSVGRALRPVFLVKTLADTIQTSAAYLESDGRKNHVAIRYDIQGDAPASAHDEMFLFRIVQNLVGNAVKAVKEIVPQEWFERFDEDDGAVFGEVFVIYHYSDGKHVIEVKDTGPGMTKETAEKILAGTARSQWGRGSGSGWGMKIVLELVAAHQGEVEIDSEVGHGTTFRVSLPHRPEVEGE